MYYPFVNRSNLALKMLLYFLGVVKIAAIKVCNLDAYVL